MGKKVLIVGGVAGGASAAARLRRLDEEAEIILFESGPYISYANCGLPYHIGGVIRSRDALLLQTPELMRERFRVDVRVREEATAIDREKKLLTVLRKETGESYTEHYDTLLLATGSSPLRPPIPGIESGRVMTLWTVPDTDRMRAVLTEKNVERAVVVGGGFIGLEMAENLSHAGAKVTLVEALNQVMAPLDYEMAQLVHEELVESGVRLHLGDGVKAFEEEEEAVAVLLNSGVTLMAELVVLAIGVRPNSALAKAANLACNARGGIVVDAHLRTSDPDIYAVGDVIEVEDFIDKSRTMIPLAGPANKQGRIAADNIAGIPSVYRGTQGTSIAKIFGIAAASTGLNEKTLTARGLVRGKEFTSVHVAQNSHAGYYPGATSMMIKLLFSMDGKKLYGAQIVGRDGVDKRIDTIAVTIRLGGGVEALKELELAYAPPFSSAKDPVNMAGYVADNVIRGLAAFAPWNVVETRDEKETLLLDVREAAELSAACIPGVTHIPLGELRARVEELDRGKEYVVMCAAGVRAYNAMRILKSQGFERVSIYPGGMRFYLAAHYEKNMNS